MERKGGGYLFDESFVAQIVKDSPAEQKVLIDKLNAAKLADQEMQRILARLKVELSEP
jgi:hypothetical protein